MANYKPSDDQLIIDYSSRMDERRRRLKTALKRISGADLKDWSLLLLICHHTSDQGPGLVRDYDELADLLWCGRRTVIRLVKRLEELDLLDVRQTFDRDGAASKNEYRLRWETIDRLAMHSINASGFNVVARRSVSSRGQDDTGGCQPDTGQCQTDTGGCQDGTSFKEELFPGTLSGNSKNPVPVPERRAVPSPHLEASHEDWLRDAGLAHIPDLVEASGRTVTPLAVGELAVRGAFWCLKDEQLRSSQPLIAWFRRQLSLTSPVCPPNEAALLLCAATALMVFHTPGERIKISRPAFFGHIVSQRKWLKVVRYVKEARRMLDDHAAKQGGAYWLKSSQLQEQTS
ncbi:MAG: hypothetical protein QM811_16660 [Pirellulales bacterium]